MEGFGQSESTVIIANLAGDSHKFGAMGKPVPLYDVHLLDPDGNEVDTGESGEVCINIKNGLPCGLSYCYEGNEEVTAETWRDGWYHTGDLAWKDEDGFFWYVGRADDVIKSSDPLKLKMSSWSCLTYWSAAYLLPRTRYVDRWSKPASYWSRAPRLPMS